MNKKYSIFISSTYEDLKEYRKYIHDAILKDGHFPIAMENFTASNKSQWEMIEPLIDECDYYLLILGFKYGSIDENTKLSYTEKEYNYAKSIDKPILSFILDDCLNIEKYHDARIKQFIENVLDNNRQVQFCKNKETVSSDVIIALNNLYKDLPKDGWIKAGKYENLKRNYDKLSLRYDEIKNPIDISDLNTLGENIYLTGYIHTPDNPWYGSNSLKDIFLLIGKHIFNAYPENHLFLLISQNIEFPIGIPEYQIEIDNESKLKIRNKLKKYGLISLSDIMNQGKTIIYWEVTEKGKYYFYNNEVDDE